MEVLGDQDGHGTRVLGSMVPDSRTELLRAHLELQGDAKQGVEVLVDQDGHRHIHPRQGCRQAYACCPCTGSSQVQGEPSSNFQGLGYGCGSDT